MTYRLGHTSLFATLEMRKLDLVSFHKDFWDCYWRDACQLLASLFPLSQKSLRELSRPSFLLGSKVATTLYLLFCFNRPLQGKSRCENHSWRKSHGELKSFQNLLTSTIQSE